VLKSLLYFTILLLLFACESDKTTIEVLDRENITQQQIDSVLAEFKFKYASPIFIDSSENILIPITTTAPSKKRWKSSYDSYESYSYSEYWNILFYNQNTDESKLLTESKFNISNYYVNLENVGNLLSKKILYNIRDIDYNQDNKLNNEDPEFLFISNTDGSELKRLSPLNENVISHTIIPNSNKILIQTVKDKNNDSVFNNENEVFWYKIDLDEKNTLTEIVDASTRKKVENLYFNQWLKKK